VIEANPVSLTREAVEMLGGIAKTQQGKAACQKVEAVVNIINACRRNGIDVTRK
jgi:hypothetical protein